MKTSEHIFTRINASLAVVFIIGIFLASFFFPNYSWDLVAYVGSMNILSGMSVQESFDATWSIMSALPNEIFIKLCCKGDYRYTMFTDPVAFESKLPVYMIKVGYIVALNLLSQFVHVISAAQLLNFLSGAAIAAFMILAYWRCEGATRLLWLPGLMLLGLLTLAQRTGPDSLAAVLYVTGMFLVIKRQYWSAIALFLLGVLVRPDNVITCFFLALAYAAVGRLRPGIVLLAGSALVYILVTRAVEHVGWWIHFYDSNIENQHSFVGFDPPFDLGLYVKALFSGVRYILAYQTWPAFLVFYSIILLWDCTTRRQLLSIRTCFGLAMVVSTTAHFLVFPWHEVRIYGPTVYPLLLLLSQHVGSLQRRIIPETRASKAATLDAADGPSGHLQ